MTPCDVIGVGRAVMDYSLLVPRYPEIDEKSEAVDRFYGSGSPVPNALSQLSVWGWKTALAAAIGDDEGGVLFCEELQRFQVDLEHIVTRQQEATPRAFLWVEQGSGRRTVVLDRAIAPLSRDELPLRSLGSARFLLIDGVEADAALAAAEAIHRTGGEVMLDAGNVREQMEQQLQVADWLIVPKAFVLAWFGSVDLFQAARDLLELGPKAVVVTNGAAGSVAAWSDSCEWFQAFPVATVDTTGAGDVFHAGFLHGLLSGWEVPECVRWASAAAALSTTKLGGHGCLPTVEDVGRLLADHGFELDGKKGLDA